MKTTKCFFCEYDRPELGDECKACEKDSNFQLKKRMTQGQTYEWELYKLKEEKALAMTPAEAIKRIKQHMYVDRIGEYPYVYLARALEMAIEALEKEE